MSARDEQIVAFLARHGASGMIRTALAGDASFRRYWRLSQGARRAVLMDMPPDKLDMKPFLTVDKHLRAFGYSAPEIMAADPALGLALLEDFGDAVLTACIETGDDPARLYGLAINWLIDLHRKGAAATNGLPPYDDGRLLEEVSRFLLWYIPAARGAVATDTAKREFESIWRGLLPAARGVPDSLVYRDYHIDNLMLLDRPGLAALGLLDFQDSVAGPITYDLVSLLEDARRDVPAGLAAAMRARYLAAFPGLDLAAFDASWAVMAAHRHIKCLGLFVRLARRDSKPSYLMHIPRLWRLLDRSLAHPELSPLKRWLDTHVPPEARTLPTAHMPTHAMVLAAGKGLRMRPITEHTPKPLVEVDRRSMLDRTFDRLDDAGVPHRVVNAHWLGEKIAAHLANHTDTMISHEDILLETGGGVANALPLLGEHPFFVCNADVIWVDGVRPALTRLAEAWNDRRMDALLLVQPVERAFGFDGKGDFFIDGGNLRRRTAEPRAPLVFTGVQILHPRLFAGAPRGPFSLNILYDRAQTAGRLFGLAHDGEWLHIGTPEALAEAETHLKNRSR